MQYPESPHDVIGRRAWLIAGALGVWLGPVGTAGAAPADDPPLEIAKTDAKVSPISEIGENILNEAMRRVGRVAVMRPLPVMRQNLMANEGDIDGLLNRIADAAKAFPNLMAVPTPIGRNEAALYTLSPQVARLSRVELRGQRFGIVRGALLPMKYSRGLNVTEAESTPAALEMLVSGRFDVAMLNHLDAEYLIAENGLRGIHRWPHAWASEQIYVYLNRKHADLVAKLDVAMKQMAAEGWIDKAIATVLRRYGIEPLKLEPPLPRENPPA